MDASSLAAAMPLCPELGIEGVTASPEEVRFRMPHREGLTTIGGGLHGGAFMALADATGGACALLNMPPGAGTATIESKTNFFRAVRDGVVEAVARPLHVGRTVVVVQTDMYDSAGRRVAQTTQTQAVLMGRG